MKTLWTMMVVAFAAMAEEAPNTVYMATDRGIFRSEDSGQTWVVFRDSYPVVSKNSI